MSDDEMDGPSSATSQHNERVYDPDQDPEEKRAVRKNYRQLQKQVDEHRTNPKQLTADKLLNHVNTANKLFGQVKGPQEATLDSAFLLEASHLGAQQARALKSGTGTFDVDEFIAKLYTFLGGRKLEENQDVEESSSYLEWDKIGRKALAKSHRVPVSGFMLGPLSLEQKKRAPVKRAKLEKNKEDMTKPEELTEEDIQRSENETSKNVATLKALLDAQGSINLFRFIINPNDFAQSVENLFHLAFLIRDGIVALETNEDGEPIIFGCEAPSDEDKLSGDLPKRQVLMELDMPTWRRAIEVFGIKEPIVPQRGPAKTKLGGKWYG